MTDRPPPADDTFDDAPEELLYNLAYCSRARDGLVAADVENIVAAARRHNPAFGITGLLVYGSGVFFQWLEGPRDSVGGLMAILRHDPRHQHVTLLGESEELRPRLFPDWDMEHVAADAVRAVLTDAREQSRDATQIAALDRLLQSLAQGGLVGLDAG